MKQLLAILAVLLTIWEPRETTITHTILISIGLNMPLWKIPLLLSVGLFGVIWAINLNNKLIELR